MFLLSSQPGKSGTIRESTDSTELAEADPIGFHLCESLFVYVQVSLSQGALGMVIDLCL